MQILIKRSTKELREILNEDVTNSRNSDLYNSPQMNSIYDMFLYYLNKEESEDDIIFKFEDRKKTVILYHQACFKHGEMLDNDPIKRIKRRETQVENPDRISVLLQPPFGILLSDFFAERCSFREVSCPAGLADITRVHDFVYTDNIRSICTEMKEDNTNRFYKYDSDTYITSGTYDAAVQAVGCVMDAVDLIMNGEYNNAFVAVRPPGHHAGYYGKVESGHIDGHSSNGFCFFNNVAIGAAYCKYKYREKIKKIAIIDFDVHHGNGTEEIIRNLSKNEFKITNENKMCNINMSTTICKPWLDYDDPENVLFISLHAFDEEQPSKFYPSSGQHSVNTSKDSSIYPGGILNIPIHGEMKYSYGYRNSFRIKVLPRLMKFKPDLIFISAGFDGHENEEINLSYMKLVYINNNLERERLQMDDRRNNKNIKDIQRRKSNLSTRRRV